MAIAAINTPATPTTLTPPPSPPSPAQTPCGKSRGSQRTADVRRNRTRAGPKAKSTSKKFGKAVTPLDGKLLKLFPKHVLRSSKQECKALKDDVTSLSAAQLERLSQLRRRELSCACADQQRKKKSEAQAGVQSRLSSLPKENARVKAENWRLLEEVALLRQQLAVA